MPFEMGMHCLKCSIHRHLATLSVDGVWVDGQVQIRSWTCTIRMRYLCKRLGPSPHEMRKNAGKFAAYVVARCR